MKGPSQRSKYDFRRVWECPACHHRERTGGDVTYLLCGCQRKLEPAERRWMKLVQEGGRRIDAPQPVPPSAPETPRLDDALPLENAASELPAESEN